MYINDDNDFKKKSFEDNVYFTMRDIFWNCDSFDICCQVNDFNSILTGGISFEERTYSFKYTNVLYEKDYIKRLHRWLKRFTCHCFEFEEPNKDDDKENKYIKFDDWWVQFEELRLLIDKQYEKCCLWEEEDVQRDCDRLAELSEDEYDH